MSLEPPPRGWSILGAMILGCGGVLLVVLGGVCSIALANSASFANGSGQLMLVSLALLGGGVTLIYRAIKLLRE